MRLCRHCAAPLDGMRPTARVCSDACRRAAARSDEALTVTRDAAAAVLLHRQSRAVQALLLAQTTGDADQAAAASRALDELDELTAQLFGATPTLETPHDQRCADARTDRADRRRTRRL